MSQPPQPQQPPLLRIWRDIVAAGWREPLLRFGTHGLILTLLAMAVWLSRLPVEGLTPFDAVEQLDSGGQAFIPAATSTPISAGVVVTAAAPPQFGDVIVDDSTLERQVNPQTLFPERSRSAIETVTVASGDTLSGIAARFNVDVSTVLWANAPVLGDDIHAVRAGQTLRILPVDGVLHTVVAGEDLDDIARAYGVTPQLIVDYRDNGLADTNARLAAGQELLIPGGRRALTLWMLPHCRAGLWRTLRPALVSVRAVTREPWAPQTSSGRWRRRRSAGIPFRPCTSGWMSVPPRAIPCWRPMQAWSCMPGRMSSAMGT